MRHQQAADGAKAGMLAVSSNLHGRSAVVRAQTTATRGQLLLGSGRGERGHQQQGREGKQQQCAKLLHVLSVPHWFANQSLLFAQN